MKKILFLVTSLFLLTTSCLTTSSSSEQLGDPVLYVCITETEELKDIAVIGLMEKNETEGMFSYSVDRYTENSAATMVLEMGSYMISGQEISFVSDDFNHVGTLIDDVIIVGDDFFTKHYK